MVFTTYHPIKKEKRILQPLNTVSILKDSTNSLDEYSFGGIEIAGGVL